MGSDLAKLRARYRKSKSRMAAELGVSRNTWGRWEDGGEVGLLERYALAAWQAGLAPIGPDSRPPEVLTLGRRGRRA